MIKLDPSESRLQDLSNEHLWAINDLWRKELCPEEVVSSRRSELAVRTCNLILWSDPSFPHASFHLFVVIVVHFPIRSMFQVPNHKKIITISSTPLKG